MHLGNKIIIILLLNIVFMLSCQKENKYEIKNITHNNILILGHRGMGQLYKYPGNTAEAILPVLGIGANGSEVDIRMTLDSVLVLFHNDILDDRTICKGKVSEKKWAEIRNCKYALTWADVNLCTADSLFGLIQSIENYYFSFDCKLDGGKPNQKEYRAVFLRAIKRLEDKYHMQGHIIVEGDIDFLLLGRKLGLHTLGCVEGTATIEQSLALAKKYKFCCVGGSVSVSEENIKKAHDSGVRVMVWSANNNMANITALDKSVDIIQTDVPIFILQQLNRYNYEYKIP